MLDELYDSLFEIVSFFVRPRQDLLLLREVGVALDTALFPLLMRVAHDGPLGIVELAGQVGRDYSTVSRQADRLVALGLLINADNSGDRRVRKVTLSEEGLAASERIAQARRTMMEDALKDWSPEQRAELLSGLGHLADTLRRRDKAGTGTPER